MKEDPSDLRVACSDAMKAYFSSMDSEVERCYEVARKARRRGFDPQLTVEIPLAADLASRVEKLLGLEGVAKRIRELSKDHNREEVSLLLAKEMAHEEGVSKEKALDNGVRVGLAVLTEGILVAPLEGIVGVKINGTGKDSYVSIIYSGPIRAAGGTGQALSVLIADLVRRELGVGAYRATPSEIERYKEELSLYTKMSQYTPSSREVELIGKNCPICIDGEGTEDAEVSGYRDLPRVETNRVRSGVCLVMAEGLCLKAAKIQKHVKKFGIDGWDFIDEIASGGKKEAKPEDGPEEKITALEPRTKFIKDVLAGRPIFCHPSRPGGFRLRHGRGRTTGLAAIAVSPATMYALDEFMAIGTQIKIERPGKAGAITPCTSIEGPIVELMNGDIVRINSKEKALELRPSISKILDVGEILIPFGEFSENNHILAPGTFDLDWWLREAEAKTDKIEPYFKNPTPEEAFKLSESLKIPLHPDYNYFWHDISPVDVIRLSGHVFENGRLDKETGALLIPAGKPPDESTDEPVEGPAGKFSDRSPRGILRTLCVTSQFREENITVDAAQARALLRCLGLDANGSGSALKRRVELPDISLWKDRPTVELVSCLAGVTVMEKSPTRIGSRMARPEKAKERAMKPAVHMLFPIGEAGGPQRLIKQVISRGTLNVQADTRRCTACRETTCLPRCHCGGRTKRIGEPRKQDIDLGILLSQALERTGERKFDGLKCVQGMTSKHKTPEPLEKGILRAKNEVFVFKDGTTRFDMTNVPTTHIRPAEVSLPVSKARALGYTHDYHGNPLESPDQLLELKAQDIVVSRGCGEYMVRVSKFIDQLLEKLYGLEPYYNATTPEDLLGHLFVGLAPHTSGGVTCRLVGYSPAFVGYAHPFFHAAKRRNCLPGNTGVILQNGKKTSLESIFDRAEGNPRLVDDYGTVERSLENLEAITVDPESGRVCQKPINKVLRVPSPNNLLNIRTKGGRSFQISPYHPLLVSNGNGAMVKKKALEVNLGDKLLAPAKLELPVTDIGISSKRKMSALKSSIRKERTPRHGSFKGHPLDAISEISPAPSNTEYLYDLEVDGVHSFVTDDLILASNCDGDEDCIMLLLDGLLNFSREFLPDRRGGLMDAPLVVTTRLDPDEIDKEAHNLDLLDKYPLEFYRACQRFAHPKEIEKLMDTVSGRIGTPGQYEGFGFTHDTEDINEGPKKSRYKTLGSMKDKLDGQLALAERIRAVDESDLASRIINHHLIRDIIGNLRKFSTQQVRCTKCKTKYRRMPLKGSCLECGNPKLTMTVHEGSVKKYLDISTNMAAKYDLSTYTKQRLQLLERSVNSLFDNDQVKKCTLEDFF